MFFKKGKVVSKTPKYGRLYVFKFTLDDNTIVHKVGMCYSDRAISRMFEVLQSFFQVHRYVPRCELRRDKKVLVPLLVEKHMHEILNDMSYTFELHFDGHTEFFKDLDEEAVLEYLDEFKYSDLLKGRRTMKEKDLAAITEIISPDKHSQKDDIIPF